jgi:hypothetical protein
MTVWVGKSPSMPSCSHWKYRALVFSSTRLLASYVVRTLELMLSQLGQIAGALPLAHAVSAHNASSLALPYQALLDAPVVL